MRTGPKDGRAPQTPGPRSAPVPEPGVVLPPGYRLEMDPDVLILRGDDGSMVAVFSAPSVDPEEVKREAEKDYRRRGESAG